MQALADLTRGLTGSGESSQARFHRRWDKLHDPHVRALAWLLDAPDLLDAQALQWEGKIATLDIDSAGLARWLHALEREPAPLHAFLDLRGMARLGRYAEKLMAFYFAWCGTLVAHGLQVQAARNDTIGEFDFLLDEGGTLVHLEFATKFYLFEAVATADDGEQFIGPNLADTLGAKMQKILQRQLALGRHPAAAAYLSQPVARAQALIKGWLFYPLPGTGTAVLPAPRVVAPGVGADHCCGLWCSMDDFAMLQADGFLLLPRLAWLAPARAAREDVMDWARMFEFLRQHFASDTMPVLLAMMACEGEVARETGRCFVVPNDWRQRAHERNQRTVLHLALERGQQT